jgi:NAD(P)H dehydrogenase (quinone)
VRFARAVAAAAKAHGVTRFVYHSVLHPQIAAMPHHWEKMRVEEMLIAGDFDVTFMQPTAYMQNILGAWHGIVADGVLVIPYPAATRLSLVDLADVGEAAARVLTTDGHSGAAYQLVGTAPLTQSEVAAAISAALGKTVRIAEETVEAWEERMRGARLGDYERSTLAAMLRAITQGTGLSAVPICCAGCSGASQPALRSSSADSETTACKRKRLKCHMRAGGCARISCIFT